MLIPALVGAASGILAQMLIDSGRFVNPWSKDDYFHTIWNMHVALFCVAVIGLFTMLLFFLYKKRRSELVEFVAGGLSLMLLALLMTSMRGCGAFVLMLFWFAASGSWARHELPPFRLGVWWGMGLVIGALAGALAWDLRTGIQG